MSGGERGCLLTCNKYNLDVTVADCICLQIQVAQRPKPRIYACDNDRVNADVNTGGKAGGNVRVNAGVNAGDSADRNTCIKAGGNNGESKRQRWKQRWRQRLWNLDLYGIIEQMQK